MTSCVLPCPWAGSSSHLAPFASSTLFFFFLGSFWTAATSFLNSSNSFSFTANFSFFSCSTTLATSSISFCFSAIFALISPSTALFAALFLFDFSYHLLFLSFFHCFHSSSLPFLLLFLLVFILLSFFFFFFLFFLSFYRSVCLSFVSFRFFFPARCCFYFTRRRY